jgi:hypothetical protein
MLPLLHYGGALLLAALSGIAFFVDAARRRSFLVTIAAAWTPFLAWLPVVLSSPHESMDWVNLDQGPGRPGIETLLAISPGGPYPALFDLSSPLVAKWVSMGALMLLLGITAVGASKYLQKRRRGLVAGHEVEILVLAVTPLMGLAGAARVGVPVYFAGRSESMVWVSFAALVVLLLGHVPRGWRLIAIGPWLLISGATLCNWTVELHDRPDPMGVSIGQHLARELENRDEVVVAGLWQLEVQHGMSMARLASESSVAKIPTVKTIPLSQSSHPGWLSPDATSIRALQGDARKLIGDARSRRARVWLVWSPWLPVEAGVFAEFAGWRHRVVVRTETIAVDVFDPPTPRPQQPPAEGAAGAQ